MRLLKILNCLLKTTIFQINLLIALPHLDSCIVFGQMSTQRVRYLTPNVRLLSHRPPVLRGDSKMYDHAAIKLLNIKVLMPGTVREM